MTVPPYSAVPVSTEPADQPIHAPRGRRVSPGSWALLVALVALVILTLLPTPYVIQRPGPVYDALSVVQTADGEEVPLIEVQGAATYPAGGNLWLTTVQLQGRPGRTPGWWELLMAWFDPSRAVIPVDVAFPQNVTLEERNERNQALMVDSQADATVAALRELGYEVPAEMIVAGIVEGSPSEGLLEIGDVLVSVFGDPLEQPISLRERIQEAGGAAVDLVVLREGEERKVSVQPELEEASDGTLVWLIGITVGSDYELPVDVTIQLDNVGGPSAGLIFALGIVDLLTPGDLTGGAHVAGTGTIASGGTVGPVGGVRQKLFGARDAGAEYFLLPPSLCAESAGSVPDGIRVVPVATLGEARDALAAIAADAPGDVPVCAVG